MNTIFILIAILASVFMHSGNEDGRIKVMTFNIRYGTANDGPNSWAHRNDLVFDVINGHNCDFIGLQEAMLFQVQEILDNCPEYHYTGVTREADLISGEASPILFDYNKWELLESKTLWLSETPEIPGSKSWNSSLPRIFTLGRFKNTKGTQEILVYNTHYDHISDSARLNSSRVLIEHIYSKTNGIDVVLLGDFNASEEQAPILYLTSNQIQPLHDTYRQIHPQTSESDMTFYGWNEHEPGKGKRLDYIFYMGSLEPLSAEVITYNADGRYPSDHMPVLAIFR